MCKSILQLFYINTNEFNNLLLPLKKLKFYLFVVKPHLRNLLFIIFNEKKKKYRSTYKYLLILNKLKSIVLLKKAQPLQLNYKNLVKLITFFSLNFKFFKYFLNVRLNLSTPFKKKSLKFLLLKNLLTNYNKKSWFYFSLYRSKKFLFRKKNQSIWLTYISSYSLIQPRLKLNFILHKSFTYQRKLTNFLFKLYKFKFLDIIYWFEFSILNILFKSSLFLTRDSIINFFKKGFILLNFRKVFNSMILVSYWDFIYLKINLWVLASLYFFKIKIAFQKFKLFIYYIKYQKKMNQIYPKTSSFRLTNKVLKYKHISPYPTFFLELDFFTLSFIILKIFIFKIMFYISSITLLFLTINYRSYNWKYIV